MNSSYALELYDHNIKIYEAMKRGLELDKIIAIIQATGTGKNHNALQYAYDNKDKKGLLLVPSVGIIEHSKEIINSNPNLDLERDFANLTFLTFQVLINMSREEIANLDIDYLIIDELHHIGAPVWGSILETLIETHPNIVIIGMSAYTTRDRGSIYERDMTNPDGDELFSNKVIYRYDLCDAWIDGVLPKPIYKGGYLHLEKSIVNAEKLISKIDKNSKTYQDIRKKLDDAKKVLNKAKNIGNIFKENIKPDGKYIYFCPPNAEVGVNDINTIMNEAKTWCREMGLDEDDYEFYITTGKMRKAGKENREAFYNDRNLKGEYVGDKLRIIFAINQYNEGVHAPGVNGVILGRSTKSDILFYEWLGRALSVKLKKEREKEYKLLVTKSIEELKDLCRERTISFSDSITKEELIELLLSPLVIDLGDNISYIKELENNLQGRVKEVTEKNETGEKREVHLINSEFNIEMINQDIFNILEDVISRLEMTWQDYYELAKAYYEKNGNLDIKQNYKTINGYEEDESGIKLGKWLQSQRQAYRNNKLSKERKDLLDEIGMIWEDVNQKRWWKTLSLAKAYYEAYGNLDIPYNYLTINGKDEFKGDKNTEGVVQLGNWVYKQRKKGKENLTEEQVKALDEIEMIWTNIDEYRWWRNLSLAKVYYEAYGNLDIPRNYLTINGKDEFKGDKNAEGVVQLGIWVSTQRRSGKENLTEEQVKALNEMGMIWEDVHQKRWWKNLSLAKAYYEAYGNLEIPQKYLTINGKDEFKGDKNTEGVVQLGIWISTQRKNGKENLTEEQVKALDEIGMIWANIDEYRWWRNLSLAKAYYEAYGNLDIPQNYITVNGKDEFKGDKNTEGVVLLGRWITLQRRIYMGNEKVILTDDKINALDEIGMIWIKSGNIKKQEEKIDDKNNKRKQIEILNRIKTFLNKLPDSKKMPSKEELNQGFIDELEIKNSGSKKL